MKKLYSNLALVLLCLSLTSIAIAQSEVEDNDYFGEATSITNIGTLTGTTDSDWQGDTWHLDFEPGDYNVSWTGDDCTRVRVIDYVDWFNPVTDDANNTPGSTGDCTYSNPYQGCFLIDNKETLSDDINQSITIEADKHYILFLNPHMCTDLSYSITFTSATKIQETKNSELSIFPNPAENILYINSKINSKISILDITGKEIISTVSDRRITNIDTSNLPSGMYFVISENRTLKFIKK